LAAAGALVLLGTSTFVELKWKDRAVPLALAPEAKVALVFGAGLLSAEEPGPVLAERLNTGIALYQAKRVKKILVSGDNSDRRHDETRAMKHYLVERGVPPADVVSDFAGFSTYDTCYRAKEIFGVRQALLVTQGFHLPRALYIANALGIDAHGVAADEGHDAGGYELRELWARPLALAMVLFRAEPRLLGPKLPIE
jgi:SanA protein